MQLITSPVVLIAIISLINVVLQTLISKKFMDPKKLKKLNEELKEYTSALDAAKKSGDKKLLKQLEKKEKYISSLQSEVTKATTYQMLLSLALTFVVFYLLSYLYKPQVPVAFIPTFLIFPSKDSNFISLDYILWFMVSSIFFSIVVRKILGMS